MVRSTVTTAGMRSPHGRCQIRLLRVELIGERRRMGWAKRVVAGAIRHKSMTVPRRHIQDGARNSVLHGLRTGAFRVCSVVGSLRSGEGAAISCTSARNPNGLSRRPLRPVSNALSTARRSRQE